MVVGDCSLLMLRVCCNQACLPVKDLDLGYNLVRTHDGKGAFVIVDHDELDPIARKAPMSTVYASGCPLTHLTWHSTHSSACLRVLAFASVYQQADANLLHALIPLFSRFSSCHLLRPVYINTTSCGCSALQLLAAVKLLDFWP